MKQSYRRGLSILPQIILAGLATSSVPEDTLRLSKGIGWNAGLRSFLPTIKVNRSASENYIKNLVMVSFNPGSSLANQLEQSSLTVAYYSSFQKNLGRALVEVTSPEERDRLAALAHADVHACGALEIFDPSLTTISLGDADSPIIPTSIKTVAVESLLSAVQPTNLEQTIASLSNLGSRYHASASPNASSDLIKSLWQDLAPGNASLSQVSHTTTTQKSVVLKIPGSDPNGKTIVIGSHLDSINPSNQSNAPGADDDASGVAALTEILRVIKNSGSTFTRPIEFHAYAAEEVGLVGSRDLAGTASSSGQSIASMLQFDMVGYSAVSGGKTIHLVTTDTSPVLVRHLKDLLNLYLGGDWKTGDLTAGTSDHRSWYRTGVHTIFAFEDPDNYNHALHTDSDTSSRLDFTLAGRFTKLGLAFLAHEAGLSSALEQSSSLGKSISIE